MKGKTDGTRTLNTIAKESRTIGAFVLISYCRVKGEARRPIMTVKQLMFGSLLSLSNGFRFEVSREPLESRTWAVLGLYHLPSTKAGNDVRANTMKSWMPRLSCLKHLSVELLKMERGLESGKVETRPGSRLADSEQVSSALVEVCS